MILGAIPLIVTGIGTFVTGRAPMTEWVLMLHVGLSPAFAIGLALVALSWPSRCYLYRTPSQFLFWLMLLTGLIVVLSGVVPMTPVFGTEGQHLLYLIHRYGGIALGVVILLHLLSLPLKSPRPRVS
jgi:hypothetical protein